MPVTERFDEIVKKVEEKIATYTTMELAPGAKHDAVVSEITDFICSNIPNGPVQLIFGPIEHVVVKQLVSVLVQVVYEKSKSVAVDVWRSGPTPAPAPAPAPAEEAVLFEPPNADGG